MKAACVGTIVWMALGTSMMDCPIAAAQPATGEQIPVAQGQKTIAGQVDDSLEIDSEHDGLEDALEAKIGSNPHSADSDNDGLSDYDEYCKYRTDPTNRDSNGDGIPDGDWEQRRQFTYTIRAVCEIRLPNDVRQMTDLYQDARPLDRKPHTADGTVVEVVLYPYATPHILGKAYPFKDVPPALAEYVRPTVEMNFTPAITSRVQTIVQGAKTDVDALEKILAWIAQETRLVNTVPEFAYVRIENNQLVRIATLGSPQADEQLLQTNFYGASMCDQRVHGTCSSLAILRGTLLRAAGLPTRYVQTLPLVNRYEGDYEPLADRMRRRIFARGYEWGDNAGGTNHTYNEVYLNQHWVRVDSVVGTSPFVGDKLFVKTWSAGDFNNLFPRRPQKEDWNQDRDFKTLDLSDALPLHKGRFEEGLADLALKPEGVSLVPMGNGKFMVDVVVQNRGSVPSPEVRLDFYAIGKQGEKRLVSQHGVGPVMPNSVWREGNPGMQLNEGETAVMLALDPENTCKDLDRSNNTAIRSTDGQ